MDLASDERKVAEATVRTNLLVFWVRTHLTLTTKRLAGTVPNTVLLIPFGRRDVTQPLDRISNVAFDTRFHIVRLALGLAFLVVLAVLGDPTTFAYVFFIGGSLLAFAYCYTAGIFVTDNSGKTQEIPVSVIDRAEIERFVGVINRQLAEKPEAAPRTERQPPPPETSPPGDRIERLTRLADLRRQGVLSEAEFDAEKRRLLES